MNNAKRSIVSRLPVKGKQHPALLVNDPHQPSKDKILLPKCVRQLCRTSDRSSKVFRANANILRLFSSSILSLLLLTTVVTAQSTFSVPGISGLSFTETDTAYTKVVTDTFWIQGVQIYPDTLTLKYEKPSGRFVLYGSAKARVEDTVVNVRCGKNDDPGIVITSRAITTARFIITTPCRLKTLPVIPDSLWFSWKRDTTFAISGKLSVILGSDTVRMTAGDASDPGILIAGGKLTALRLSATTKFSLKTLTFIPDTLGFSWLADSSFALHGSLSVILSNDTVKLSSGTVSQPGIIFSGGHLQKFQLLANGTFKIKTLSFIPDSLGFTWLADSSFAMFGALSVIVSADTITLTAGSITNPGIEFMGGHLKKLRLLAKGKFAIKALTFIPDSLGFTWLADSSFAMYGSLSVLVAADSIRLSAGTPSNPGIMFTGGRLTKLDLQSGGKFSIKKLTFIPDSLGFTWLTDSGFAIHGSLSVLVGTDTIKVSAGGESNPGIVITGGRLIKIHLMTSAKFSIKSITYIPDSLGLEWIADSGFVMFGSLSFIASSDTINVSAGSVAKPGIVIAGGKLTTLRLVASAKFSIKSLTFIPDSLGFTWLEDSSFAMHGSLSIIVAEDTIQVSAGSVSSPGILFTGGRLVKLRLLTNAKFSVKTLTFIPDSLGFNWLADSSFAMHGSLSVLVANDTIRVSAGSPSSPGILFTGGRLVSLRLMARAKFSIKTLTLIPDSLGFAWLADSSFAMYGSLSVLVAADSIRLSAGTMTHPGIMFSGNRLTKLELQAGGKFSIKKLTFMPDSLGFTWLADSGFAMHGALSVVVATDTIRLMAGTLADPGILITGGRLVKLRLLTSAKFSVKALTFIPDSLGFSWLADSSFVMHGSLSVLVGTDTISLSAGSVQNPGIAISGGALTKLQLTASTKFSFKGITVMPHGIGFSWNSDGTNMFSMYGDVTVTVDSSVLRASFGTASRPGFVIVNGVVTRWALSLTDTLKHHGLNLALTDASLAYDATKHLFSIWGGATVVISRDTVSLILGNESQPGILFVDGKLTSFSAGVTATFKVGGLTLNPDRLTIAWNDSMQTITVYGSLISTFGGQTTSFLAGSKTEPGIRIVNGAVKSLHLGVSTDLHIASLVIKPRGLTFAWADSGMFKLYGTATIGMHGDTMTVILGDSAKPGILIVGNTLEYCNVGVTADFHLKSLRIQPKALTFRYDKSTGNFSLYGGIAVHIAGDSIAALLGDSASPGFVYANGTVKKVHIGISAGFKMKSLSIKTDSLTIVWSNDSNYFALYGGARITIGPDSIGCDFGTALHPGLIVKAGQLTYLSINVNSDIKIGNLEIRTQDLDLVYENMQYTLRGTCSVKQVFSVSLTLGSGNTPGIILDVSTATPQLQVKDLLFEIAHANLGAIDLKDFKLAIKDGQIAYSTVDVAFPGGWEVGAGIAFKGSPARIDSIGVDWMATNIQSAIVLPNGMLLVGMKGSLKNMTNPSALTFSGDVLLLYGGPVSINDREGALLYLRTGVTISSTGMTLGADAKVGAYRIDANWYSALGDGSLTLAVVWGRSAKLVGDFEIPSPPNKIVEIKPLVYLDAQRNFDAMLDVTFFVPGSVPFVGGQVLGGADGAMRYRYGNLWSSYAAAWVYGSTLGWNWTVGAEYNFGSRNISVIGDGNVSDIRRDIDDDTRPDLSRNGGLTKTAGRTVRSIVHSFTTTNPPPSLLVVSVLWPKKVDSTVVTVLGPEGFYELTKVEKMSGDSLSVYKRTQKIERDFAVVQGDSLASFIVAPYASFTFDSSVNALLPPGQYQVICTSYDTDLDSVGLTVLPMYKTPKAEIWLSDGPVVNVRYSSMQMDSTLVDIYVSDSPSYTGRIAGQFSGVAAGTDGTALVDTSFRYHPHGSWIAEADSLWFYAVIEDGLNPPYLTPIVGPYYMPPALRGGIMVTEGVDTVTTGLMVFIDDDGDGSWDTQSSGQLEIHGVTDQKGKFRLPAIPVGMHNVKVLVPPGYSLFLNNQQVNTVPIDYRGSPLELNLALKPGVPE